MKKRRKPLNYFNIILLVALIGVVVYFNYYVAPTVQTPFEPTPTATRDPESYVTEAQQYYADGKLKQAADAYQQAIQVRPNDAASYIELARIEIFIGQYKAAQTSAENALLLSPNNAEAHALRGWSLEWQGDYLGAETSIKRALELDPNNAEAHAYYAVLYADEYIGNTGPFDVIDRMSAESTTALNLGPGLLESHYARGYVLEVTGNYEDAVHEYEAAAAINPNIPEVELALGRNYRALGVYDKAITALTRASTLNPSDPTPNYLISRVYATVGEYAKAEQYAQQAVATSPSDSNMHGNLGVMYYHNFKIPDALKELALAINGGKTDDGIDVQSLSLTANTRAPEYYFTYGLALAKTQRCEEALPIAQKILTQIPDDQVSVYNANQIISICSQAAGTTVPSATSAPAETTAPGDTPAPAATTAPGSTQ